MIEKRNIPVLTITADSKLWYAYLYQNGTIPTIKIEVVNTTLYTRPSDTEIKTLIKKYTDNHLEDGDRVYFSKFSDVPRYKFNEYAADKNIARVRDLTNANTIAISIPNLISRVSSLCRHGRYSVTAKEMWQSVVSTEIYQQLDEKVYVDTTYYEMIDALFGDKRGTFARNTTESNEYFLIPGGWSNKQQDKERLADLMSIFETGIERKYILDENILSEINQGIEITKEVYEQLEGMFASTDINNVNLGMEILANADYRKSEFKILLLLRRFYDNMMKSSNSKLVNFRSLLVYFSKYQWREGNDFKYAQALIENATEDKEDHQEMIDLALDMVTKNLQSYVGKFFKINVDYKEKAPANAEAL